MRRVIVLHGLYFPSGGYRTSRSSARTRIAQRASSISEPELSQGLSDSQTGELCKNSSNDAILEHLEMV